jgi:hypothetical protein
MNGDQIADAKGFGDHSHVGTKAGFHQVVGTNAALGLPHHAGDHQVTLQPDSRLADGLSGHDDAGQAALHVLNAVAVKMISLNYRCPGISTPAARQRVNVGVAVQHQTLAAAGALQSGDGLEPPRFHFLQVYFVAALVKEVGQEVGHRSFLKLETGNLNQLAGQVYDGILINLINDFSLCWVHVGGPTP